MSNIAQYPTWLAVPIEERDNALRAHPKLPDGSWPLTWDKENKLWFANPGVDLALVKPWLPRPDDFPLEDNASSVENYLRDRGFTVPDRYVTNGKWQRIKALDDKDGKSSGAYKAFPDGAGLLFRDYRQNDKPVYLSLQVTGKSDLLAELHLRASRKQKSDDSNRERETLYNRLSRIATRTVTRLPQAETHPYLTRKTVQAAPGVRVNRRNELVIPLTNANNEIRSYQRVPGNGGKYLLKDAEKAGNYFLFGTPEPHTPVLFAEGYATAASLHEASGLPVVMTVDASNMVAVAESTRNLWPDSPKIFCADDDHHLESKPEGNKGLKSAQKAAERVGGLVISPPLTDEDKAAGLTDFNDIDVNRGREAFSPLIHTLLSDIAQVIPNNVHEQVAFNAAEPTQQSGDMAVSDNHTPSTPQPPEPVPEYIVPDEAYGDDDELTRQLMADYLPAGSDIPFPDYQEYAAGEVQPEPYAQGTENSVSPAANILKSDIDDTAPDNSEQIPDETLVIPEQQEESVNQAHAEPHIDDTAQASDQTANAPGQQEESAHQENTEADTIRTGPARPIPGMTPPPVRHDIEELLKSLSHTNKSDYEVLYSLGDQPAFSDFGDRFEMAPGASKNDQAVLAALSMAARYYGGTVELTGSDEFKQNAMRLIVEYDLNIKMKLPSQREGLEHVRESLQASQVNNQDSVVTHRPEESPVQAEARPDIPETPTAPAPSEPVPAAPVSGPAPEPENRSADKQTVPAQPSLPDDNPRIKPGHPVTGLLKDYGSAPAHFDDSKGEGFYVTLQCRSGDITLWGKDFENLVKDYQKGDPVTINLSDRETLENGHFRNHWKMTPAGDPVARPSDAAAPGDKLQTFPAESFKYVMGIIAAEQSKYQSVLEKLPAPSQDIILQQNGKPVKDENIPASATYSELPEPDINTPPEMVAGMTRDGRLEAVLYRTDGEFFQGAMRFGEKMYPVLVAPSGDGLTVTAITEKGPRYAGHGTAIRHDAQNQPLPPEKLQFSLSNGRQGAKTVTVPITQPKTLSRDNCNLLGFQHTWREWQEQQKKTLQTEKQMQQNFSPAR